MRSLHDNSRLLASVALALALVALAVRIALPAGFMLSQADGGAAIEICSSQGAVLISDDGQAGAPADESPVRGDPACAYAAVGSPLLGAAGPHLAKAAWSFERIAQEARAAQSPSPSLIAPPPPQTGPPALA
jgi:hypothetical protein